MSKETYTTSELAKEFNVDANTVRQWVSRGLITPLPDKVKVGRGNKSSVFSIDEIRRFSQERYGHE